jgi:adenylate cyclase
VVKHIGDEVMFVALDADAGCATALALIDGYTDAGITPRGGLAYGDVVTRHGDYYGSVVNVASRLADLAIPGEVLLTPEVAAAVSGAGATFTPAGRRLLKGFEDPVELLSLSRT